MDISQRFKEIARYYHAVLEPVGEVPLLEYFTFTEEADYLKLDYLGREGRNDERIYESSKFTGTVIVETRYLGPNTYGDWAGLRAATPVARLGNASVYRGTLDIGPILAVDRYWHAIRALYAENPDLVAAEKNFRLSAELDPTCFYVFINLGNIYLARGDREQAVRAYQDALKYAPSATIFRREIEEQLHQMDNLPIEQLRPLRDPSAE